MNENITVAIISASAAVAVSIVALLVNVIWIGRTFDQLGKNVDRLEKSIATRFEVMESSMTIRFEGVERRLGVIESDIKEFFRIQSQQAADLQRLRDNSGLS